MTLTNPALHVAMNMSEQQVTIELLFILGRAWCLAVDTSLKAAQDIVPPQDQKAVSENFYPVNTRTIVVFDNGHR